MPSVAEVKVPLAGIAPPPKNVLRLRLLPPSVADVSLVATPAFSVNTMVTGAWPVSAITLEGFGVSATNTSDPEAGGFAVTVTEPTEEP